MTFTENDNLTHACFQPPYTHLKTRSEGVKNIWKHCGVSWKMFSKNSTYTWFLVNGPEHVKKKTSVVILPENNIRVWRVSLPVVLTVSLSYQVMNCYWQHTICRTVVTKSHISISVMKWSHGKGLCRITFWIIYQHIKDSCYFFLLVFRKFGLIFN